MASRRKRESRNVLTKAESDLIDILFSILLHALFSAADIRVFYVGRILSCVSY